ncbi:MAG: electron transport complex subunit RsxC [SAR324 cluster bacterium]|nr:electron transport complex subunit RsxC [SAR324 cluster bacterium]
MFFIFTQKNGKQRTFKRGSHPEHHKGRTEYLPIERMPFVEEYTLPLSQHIGAPSLPIVQKGQQVQRGEVIAKPGGFVSVSLHSPVTGMVTAVELSEHPNGQMLPAIKIKTDPYSTQCFGKAEPLSDQKRDKAHFISSVQSSGIVGMGGAAFPAHVKFFIPEGKHCQFLVINGCECEPFLTADHRVMVEQAPQLIEGIGILAEFLGAQKTYIGIEANKPDAIVILNELAVQKNISIEVVPLQVKYPQGAEKMLITAVLKQEVPSGKLPLDVETVVSNVGTVIALTNYFTKSEPLVERVVTVTGSGIKRPANLLVPIGTPIQEIINVCGGLNEGATRVLLGGPMMGVAQKNLGGPVLKGTSGILVLTDEEVQEMQLYKCIRCGRCLQACPIFLNPSHLGLLARKGLYDDMAQINLMDCMECACCSFVCPSGIPLVQSFRVAKAILREKEVKQ